MNCREFESVLPDYLESGHTSEQQKHVSSCPACAGLVADLNFISTTARQLQDTDDPSPAVWNALERQLRREGLIRDQAIREIAPSRPSSLLEFFRTQRAAWLVPVAAALVLAAGVKLYRPAAAGDTNPVAKVKAPAPLNSSAISTEDERVLNTVAERFPAQQASYRKNLEQANSYIRDAEQSIRNDPNDEYSQELLIDAYEQKQMLYELAVARAGEQ